MKPLMLHGHERSITQIKYNREGDLLFSCSKDQSPNVWYALNGERLGSFIGHGGAVWCMDVNWETTRVISGAADNTCKIWDPERGKCLNTLTTKTAVRSCGFSYSGQLLMYSTDRTMGHPCEIHLFDIDDGHQIENSKPAMVIAMPDSKVTSAIWCGTDNMIITGHENGELNQWDIKTGKKLFSVKDHTNKINDIQLSKDGTMLITASKDTTAKLFDVGTLENLKTFKTERPVNSASISPLKEHVVLGGGQEAMEVTTTSTRIGKFDARFYSLVFEEEFGRIKGHFGPINSLAFQPDGLGYSSGGEDGYVRVHQYDQEYFDFDFEY